MHTTQLPQQVDRFFARQDWLDDHADHLQELIHDGFSAAGELGHEVEDVLHGKFLGHPLHPVLIELPIGAWVTVGVLDLLEVLGVKGLEKGSNAVLGIGLLGSGAAVAAGWTDWHKLKRLPRRIGLVHGLMNETAQAVYLLSLIARLKGRRRAGRMLALGGLSIIGVSAYLGGHLVYKHRVGMGGPLR
ncbi:DUF2231 domain-containing protein [Deinococcus peraridilitoris]|uniref:Putative membrane protein n=1 Tax=Deinococcus peraridilitoris (strain DSM 19664 / LMG 22246 / CIP 109416 / KR-200) TaxID=937777 RepID=L0A447_DEIPD|nr:DUF2231 domain-containing protein [Deinococcus peraridilitoris]AFZ68606.1 putative membrane protein [Deinococcus peraridilitoris DSM 19664]